MSEVITAQEQPTSEQRINDLEAAAIDYIKADSRFRGPGYDGETVIMTVGSVIGTAVVAVGVVDLFGTYVNGYNPTEGRDQVSRRMDDVIQDLDSRLEGNAQQIEICTEIAGDACSETEVFDLRTNEGVQIFAQGTLEHHPFADGSQEEPLERLEAEELEQAIWSLEAPEGRSEEFDQEILSAMQVAADEYVTEVPNDSAPTTNSFTGEITGIGFGIIVAGLAAGGLMRLIRRKNTVATTESFRKMRELSVNIPNRNTGLGRVVHDYTFNGRVHHGTGLEPLHRTGSQNINDCRTHLGIINGKRAARTEIVRDAAEVSREELDQAVDA